MAAAAIEKELGGFDKVCACGASYTREQWAELPHVGEQDDGIDVWELRRCRCGSTLAVYRDASPDRLP